MYILKKNSQEFSKINDRHQTRSRKLTEHYQDKYQKAMPRYIIFQTVEK